MALAVTRMSELDLSGKRVLIRQDLNVPIRDGEVASTARIDAALPTLQAALDSGAAVLVMSHLGRPKEGEPAAEFSLAPVARCLADKLGVAVPLAQDWLDGVSADASIDLVEGALYGERYISQQPGYYQGIGYVDTRYGQYTTQQLKSYPFGYATYANADLSMAYGQYFVTANGWPMEWEATGAHLPEGFAYASDTNERWLTREAMMDLIDAPAEICPA